MRRWIPKARKKQPAAAKTTWRIHHNMPIVMSVSEIVPLEIQPRKNQVIASRVGIGIAV